MSLNISVDDRILVTGAPGFLGSHIVPVLQTAFPQAKILPVSRKQYDLLHEIDVHRMFAEQQPSIVVHLAAKVGGIVANHDFPADFCHDNLLNNALVFREASQRRIRKLVAFMGGCSYPATARIPIDESQFWQGFPQPESAAYSTAKMMQLVLSQAYRQQYGLNSIVLVPGNVYGEFDNFTLTGSHVIPALIRKFVEAREAKRPTVEVFGSGKPARDFVYAGDVAALLPYFITQYDSSEPINLSTQTTTIIRDLAETISRLTRYAGELVWNTSRPDGQMLKIFSTEKMRNLGLACPTTLTEGLKRTITWFEANRHGVNVRL